LSLGLHLECKSCRYIRTCEATVLSGRVYLRAVMLWMVAVGRRLPMTLPASSANPRAKRAVFLRCCWAVGLVSEVADESWLPVAASTEGGSLEEDSLVSLTVAAVIMVL